MLPHTWRSAWFTATVGTYRVGAVILTTTHKCDLSLTNAIVWPWRQRGCLERPGCIGVLVRWCAKSDLAFVQAQPPIGSSYYPPINSDTSSRPLDWSHRSAVGGGRRRPWRVLDACKRCCPRCLVGPPPFRRSLWIRCSVSIGTNSVKLPLREKMTTAEFRPQFGRLAAFGPVSSRESSGRLLPCHV